MEEAELNSVPEQIGESEKENLDAAVPESVGAFKKLYVVRLEGCGVYLVALAAFGHGQVVIDNAELAAVLAPHQAFVGVQVH